MRWILAATLTATGCVDYWTVSEPEPVWTAAGTPALGADGALYAFTATTFAKLDPATGTALHATATGATRITALTADVDGAVALGTDRGIEHYPLGADAPDWIVPFGPVFFRGELVAAPDGKILVSATAGEELVAFADGAMVWDTRDVPAVLSFEEVPAIGFSDKEVRLVEGGALVVLDLASGAVLGMQRLVDAGPTTEVALADGFAVARGGGADDAIAVFDLAGAPRATVPARTGGFTPFALAAGPGGGGSGGDVIATYGHRGDDGGPVLVDYALADAATGQLVRSAEHVGRLFAPSAVHVQATPFAGGAVTVTDAGLVVVLDDATFGLVRW